MPSIEARIRELEKRIPKRLTIVVVRDPVPPPWQQGDDEDDEAPRFNGIRPWQSRLVKVVYDDDDEETPATR
jgi:hypothetical protein